MDNYYPGGGARVSTTFADINGAPADPSEVTLIVTQPDGSTATYLYTGGAGQIQRSGLGAFYLDLTIADNAPAGAWDLLWKGTGIRAANVDSFRVLNPGI
jgi:uncharacterized protein YfaS (alpha-2-macroglobulin family)